MRKKSTLAKRKKTVFFFIELTREPIGRKTMKVTSILCKKNKIYFHLKIFEFFTNSRGLKKNDDTN